MNNFKTTGVVLREFNVSESDKRIIILTKDYGKLVVFVKGARKSNSKFLSATSPFCLCNFVLHKGNGFISVSQAELINSFYNLRNSFEALCYGAFFLELVEKTSLPEINCNDILKMLVRVLNYLCKPQHSLKLINFVFVLKLLKLLGHMPNMFTCVYCDTLINEDFKFSFQLGGILCKKCLPLSFDSILISKATLLAFRFVLKSDLSNMFAFNVSDTVLTELDNIIFKYLSVHIDVKLATLNYITQIDKYV